jgi:phosphatidylinositol alpha-1,6-mannosyltransferase
MDKLAVKRIRRITVLSRYTQKRVKRIYHRDSRIIRMGTNLENFNTNLNHDKVRKIHEIYDRPCILTVANFAKRVDLILNALTIVKKEISDAVLLIVGTGDDSTLRNLIRKCGLEGSVVIAKNVDDNALPFYYAACDVFVFPQPHWAWSLVTIEAMACGKPVIIPENCGVAEIIKNNYNGIKINILNAKNLATYIINLLKDEDLRKRIGAAGRRYVELNLNENYFLESYYQLIKNEVERSKCAEEA